MIKRIFVAAAAAALISSPALASHCPLDVKAVGEALAANASLSAEEKGKVQGLMDKGAKQHADGDHSGSVETLHKARHMLGIDH
mgnify:CR=1 FL=1|jgi:hypothetical protein